MKAPSNDKELVWDEFPFDPDEAQNSDCIASYEVAVGGEGVFEEEVCLAKLHIEPFELVAATKEEYVAIETFTTTFNNDSLIELGAAITFKELVRGK